MLATSPLAIFFYVILAMLLVSAIGRRLLKEKLIAGILRTPPRNITRTINSYRMVAKIWKILIVGYGILVPLLIYMYFSREKGEWTLLLAAGYLTLLSIIGIEDIQYKNTVIEKLEAEQARSQKGGAAHISEKDFKARMRKNLKIVIPLYLILTLAILTSIYLIVGVSLWLCAPVLTIVLFALAWVTWRAYKK